MPNRLLMASSSNPEMLALCFFRGLPTIASSARPCDVDPKIGFEAGGVVAGSAVLGGVVPATGVDTVADGDFAVG
jgi:hypothetical protein